MLATCTNCLDLITGGERFVLVQRGREQFHCSRACLFETVQRQRRARAAVRNRWLLRAAAVALVVVGTPRLWHHFRVPRAKTIAYEAPPVRPATPVLPAPVFYGPAWPPTDQDWLTAFANSEWIYPLPGPVRRAPLPDPRLLTAQPSAGRPLAVCRTPDHCGVDVGGELWGEQVYAAHDGVVDHIQRAFDGKGDVYLRLVHFGGMVFTHYLHLASIPRTITRGTVVRAGEVIGLVGDTGNERPGHYIHFALSVRPSSALPEVYWDPTELMAKWPLRVPPHGTVAGFVPPETDLAIPPFHHHAR